MKILTVSVIFFLFLPTSMPVLHGRAVIEKTDVTEYGKGCRYNIGGWIYLHIEGGSYERGFQHGFLLAGEIIDMMERWSRVVHNMRILSSIGGKPDSDRYDRYSERWWDFCRNRITRIYWKDYPEEYREEIRGIADGVTARGYRLFGEKVTYRDVLTLNEMYEFMSRLTHPCKGIHPFRSLLYMMRGTVCSEKSSLVSMSADNGENSHCSGFIATGNATTHGQMIIAHSTWFGKYWFPYYIPQRWNVILDVSPDRGYRFIVATSPGLIWSDEDYYQNEKGIAFIETTVYQGLWRDRGLPLAVRARLAVQYGKSIDDVIDYLVKDSDGIMNAVWLIGDANSGEIARLETGLFVYSVKRTFDGFYWSAVNAESFRVRSEQLRLQSFVVGRYLQLLHFFDNNQQYKYFTREYRPADRDLKFEELGKKYYGKIDTDVVKKILSTPPISEQSTECKITDSFLIKDNGLWIFWGCPDGRSLEVTKFKEELPEKAIKVEPTGWIKIFGLSSECRHYGVHSEFKESLSGAKVLWHTSMGSELNDVSPDVAVSGDCLYVSADGYLASLNISSGMVKWKKILGESVTPPIASDVIAVGSDRMVYTFSSDGMLIWKATVDENITSVGMNEKVVVAGTRYGKMYIFDRKSGNRLFDRIVAPNSPAHVSVHGNKIAVCAGRECMFFDEGGNILCNLSVEETVLSPLSIYGNTLYAGCQDSCLYAINISSGRIKWRFQTGWEIVVSPVEGENTIFVASTDGNLYALDRETGKLLWYFSANAAIRSPPLIYGDYVFFGSDDGRFYALNRTTGICEWFFAPKYTIENDVYNYVTTPIVSHAAARDGKVFFGARNCIYALDAHTSEKEKKESRVSYYAIWAFVMVPITVILILLGVYLYRTRD